LRHGWHVTVAYVIGFAAFMIIAGWQPHPPHKAGTTSAHLGVEIYSPTSAL